MGHPARASKNKSGKCVLVRTLLSVPSKVERLVRRCVIAVTAFVTIAMITSRSLFSAAAFALSALPEREREKR